MKPPINSHNYLNCYISRLQSPHHQKSCTSGSAAETDLWGNWSNIVPLMTSRQVSFVFLPSAVITFEAAAPLRYIKSDFKNHMGLACLSIDQSLRSWSGMRLWAVYVGEGRDIQFRVGGG